LLYNQALLTGFRSRNRYSASTVDQYPKQVAVSLVFGGPFSIPVPDIDRSRYLLMLGANPMASNGSLWTVPDFRGRVRRLKASEKGCLGGTRQVWADGSRSFGGKP